MEVIQWLHYKGKEGCGADTMLAAVQHKQSAIVRAVPADAQATRRIDRAHY